MGLRKTVTIFVGILMDTQLICEMTVLRRWWSRWATGRPGRTRWATKRTKWSTRRTGWRKQIKKRAWWPRRARWANWWYRRPRLSWTTNRAWGTRWGRWPSGNRRRRRRRSWWVSRRPSWTTKAVL